jgi:hypothetical protein
MKHQQTVLKNKQHQKKYSHWEPRMLLKGVQWGEFFNATKWDFHREGEILHMRVGFFFTIPACAIIYKGKYVVLRKIITATWGVGDSLLLDKVGTEFFSYRFNPNFRDHSHGTNWWFLGIHDVRYSSYLTSICPYSYVLAHSKSDLLKGHLS